jgi:hypothetical protein
MYLLLGLMVACSSEADPGVKTTTAATKGEALPDLVAGLNRKGCDNGPGGSGAASYFVGELNISGTDVKGAESWLLYANEKWKANNGRDCTVHWNLHGSKTSTSACGACSFGVSLTNALDKVASNCPEDMAKGETGQAINYDIQLKDDGRAVVYFSKSGKKVGEGYHANGKIKYVTDMSCRWF